MFSAGRFLNILKKYAYRIECDIVKRMNELQFDVRKLSRALRYVLLGGIFLIPFIPFIVTDFLFFPFITGKSFFFRVLVEILLGVWAVAAYLNPAYRPRWSLIVAAFTAFLGVIGFADAFGLDPFKSFWSNYERMEGFALLLHLFGYFILAITVLQTEKLWVRFFQVSIAVSAAMGIYGVIQLAGGAQIHQGGVRLDGSFGNAAYLSSYLLFHIFLAGLLLAKELRNRSGLASLPYAYGAVIFLNLFVLYFTATRGAILGLIGGAVLSALLIALFARGDKERVIRKWSVGFVAGIALLVFGFILAKDTDFVRNSPVLARFASISLEETTTKSRFLIWDMAIKGFRERPVLGWGQENFNFVFNKYYDPQMYAQEPWFDRAHNIIFDWLIAGGVLGLLAYLSLFAAALRLLWRKASVMPAVEKSILTGLLAAYFFQNLFVFDNLITYILFFSVLGYIHTISENREPEDRVLDRNPMNVLMLGAVSLVVSGFFLYGFNYHAYAAAKELLVGIGNNSGGAQVNLEYFKKALAHNSFSVTQIREQLVQTTFRVLGSRNASEDVKTEFLALTKEEMRRQAEDNPRDARHQLFYASYLNTIGAYDEAVIYLDRALALSPKKPQIFFEYVAVYVNMGEYDTALEYARRVFEDEPRYDEARKLYALAAVYAGDIALSDELLAPVADRLGLGDGSRFAAAYTRAGRYDKAVELWKSLIARDPKNVRYYISLAVVQLEAGLRQDSIESLEKAIEADPQFRELGEFYISEIRAGRNP